VLHSQFEDSLGYIMRSYLQKKRVGGVPQVVEWLSSKNEVLRSSPSTTQYKKPSNMKKHDSSYSSVQ
jgi:hypothetical protein